MLVRVWSGLSDIFQNVLYSFIYCISNIYISDDTVYMKDNEQREEYVLNDSGRIWRARRERGSPWNFGQVGNKTTYQ